MVLLVGVVVNFGKRWLGKDGEGTISWSGYCIVYHMCPALNATLCILSLLFREVS